VAQLLLRDGVGVVDLVAEDDKGHLGQLLHGQEGVELGLGLGESLVVLGINEEHDAIDLGEVVLPETAGCGGTGLSATMSCSGGERGERSLGSSHTLLVTTEIKSRKPHVADGELLGSWGGTRKVSIWTRAPPGTLREGGRKGASSGGETYWGEEWAGGWRHGRSVEGLATEVPLLAMRGARVWSAGVAACSLQAAGAGHMTYLQHVKQRRLSGIVETEEEQLGVLVEQAERGEHVVDCRGARAVSACGWRELGRGEGDDGPRPV
jgi:hypothetical protein